LYPIRLTKKITLYQDDTSSCSLKIRVRLTRYLFYLLGCMPLIFAHKLSAQNSYPVKVNQKWGLIDANGELVVSPKYEVIGTPEKFGYALMQQGGKIGILNQQGKVLLPAQYEEIQVLDSNFMVVVQNEEQQVITAKGEIILKGNQYTQFKVLNSRLLVFAENNLLGCVNTVGRIVATPKYDAIMLFKNKFLKVKKGALYGLLDFTGKQLLPTIADAINQLDNDLIFYLKGVLWGAVDIQGKPLIEPNYSEYHLLNKSLIKLERFGENWLFNISERRLVSAKSSKDFMHFSGKYVLTRLGYFFGLVDYQANEILPNQYQEIQSFSANAFRVRNGWKWGLVDKVGQQLLGYSYDFIAPARKGKALVKKGSFFGLIGENGKVLIPAVYTRITISGENIKAFQGEKWTLFFLDNNGKIQEGGNFKKHFKIQIKEKDAAAELSRLNQGDFGNNYLLENFEWFFVGELGKWGLRRLSDGENVIPPTYDFIRVERDLGYTIVGLEKQGQYRFDRTNYRFNYVYGIVQNEVGKLVTQLTLWDVRSDDFRNGSLVARVVFNNGRFGLMLRNGKFVKKDYGYIGEFENGLARISIGGKISAKLNSIDQSLGLLPNYLEELLVGSDMTDITIHDQKIQEEAYLTCEDCAWGFIDTTAFVTIQPKYEVAHEFVNDVCLVQAKGKWGMIDQMGNDLLPPKFDVLNFIEGTGHQIVKLTINASKYGLMDTLGQLLVELKYDELGVFKEDKLAVRKGNNWGYVAKN